MLFVTGTTAIVMALVTLTVILSATSATSNGILVIRDTCKIEFLVDDASQNIPEAFSLDKESWYTLAKKCNAIWEDEVEEMTTVKLINKGEFERAAANFKNSKHSVSQHLRIVVLLGYEKDDDSKVAGFCSTLGAQELRKQCYNDVFNRMVLFNHYQDLGALSFWFYLGVNGSYFDENSLSTINASKLLVVSEIVDEIQGECQDSKKNRCLRFAGLQKDVQRYFLPMIIADFFKKTYDTNKLLHFTNKTLQDLDCFAYNQIYLQMRLNSQLDNTEALELRILSQKSKTKNESCDAVECALLEHTRAHAKPFLDLFDKKKYDELRKNRLTVEIVGELVKERYKGGNKTKALMSFLWNVTELSDIACVGSLALVKEMNKSGNLASVEALSLFSHVNQHRGSFRDNLTWLQSCIRVQESAPDFVKHFIYGDNKCGCCDLSSTVCVDYTLEFLDSISNTNLSNVFTVYPLEVLFIRYVLHKLTTSNVSVSQDHRIAALNSGFHESYKSVFEDLYYQSNEIATHSLRFDSLVKFFNKDVYAYVKSQVDQRDSAGSLDQFLSKSEDEKYLNLKCNSFETYYKAMQNRTAEIASAAFAFWLYIESYVLDVYKDLKHKDMRVECEEVERKLRNTSGKHLQEYFRSWRDPSQLTRIIEWHRDFWLGSIWVLPKLVRHVFLTRNETTAKSLIDFFGDLVTKSNNTMEKFELCAGLNELIAQMEKSGDIRNENLALPVQNLFPETPNYIHKMHQIHYDKCNAVIFTT